MYVTEASMSVL